MYTISKLIGRKRKCVTARFDILRKTLRSIL